MIQCDFLVLITSACPRAQANIAKWMTLPVHSGTMSQLYRGFSRISMIAKLAGATVVASMLSQFDPFTKHFASP